MNKSLIIIILFLMPAISQAEKCITHAYVNGKEPVEKALVKDTFLSDAYAKAQTPALLILEGEFDIYNYETSKVIGKNQRLEQKLCYFQGVFTPAGKYYQETKHSYKTSPNSINYTCGEDGEKFVLCTVGKKLTSIYTSGYYKLSSIVSFTKLSRHSFANKAEVKDQNVDTNFRIINKSGDVSREIREIKKEMSELRYLIKLNSGEIQ